MHLITTIIIHLCTLHFFHYTTLCHASGLAIPLIAQDKKKIKSKLTETATNHNY